MFIEKMVLDRILEQRRSIREFDITELPEEKLEAVIEAGRLAPFAGLVQKNTSSFRHFFVIHRDSETAEKIKALCEDGRKKEVVRIQENGLAAKYPEVAKIAKAMSEKPANDIFISPWLIIVAERGGLPQREEVCLGYVMENMWLKATEMDLAFRICSGVSDIHDKEGLKKVLGLDDDETYAFDACNIGYPKNPVEERRSHPKPVKSIKYFR